MKNRLSLSPRERRVQEQGRLEWITPGGPVVDYHREPSVEEGFQRGCPSGEAERAKRLGHPRAELGIGVCNRAARPEEAR